jgi:hypothetical protein
MARRAANSSEPEDDLIAEVLCEAGMEPGHKSYKKKYRQLVRLEVSDYECERLLDLPEETLEFLFKGSREFDANLSKFDRRGLFEAMRVDWEAAIRAMTDLGVGPEELIELKHDLGNYGAVGSHLVQKGRLD